MNTNTTQPIPITPELIEALDYILDKLEYVLHIPPTNTRAINSIRLVCEAIKSSQPLPFKKGE